MARDPAFLFYPNDWIGGTMSFTFEQKGAYFELLMLQFNKGRFTEAQAKQVLSICPGIWSSIREKFKTDGTYFWNERLDFEVQKRKKFTESRRNNAKSKKNGSEHMPQHMENANTVLSTNKNDKKFYSLADFEIQGYSFGVSDLVHKTLNSFLKYRFEAKGEPIQNAQIVEMIIKTCQAVSRKDEDIVWMIENTIAKGAKNIITDLKPKTTQTQVKTYKDLTNDGK